MKSVTIFHCESDEEQRWRVQSGRCRGFRVVEMREACKGFRVVEMQGV